MQIRGPYATRTVRFQQVVEHRQWQVKVYRITRHADAPDFDSFFQGSAHQMLDLLPDRDSLNHGMAILTLHHGEDRHWLLLNWWFDQEILKQRLYSSPADAPERVTEAESDIMACTWEMAVHCFERQAWLDTVLANPAGPDSAAYLARQLNAEI